MEWLHNFHFIRPLWLLLIIPALAAVFLFRQRRKNNGQWQQVIDPLLLPYLLDGNDSQKPASPFITLLMALAAFIVAIALAGPTWQKIPQPVAKNQDALVIMMDMSLSMGSQDLSPSRYVRAIQKVTDIVRSRQDGQTALIVYDADAYTVAPLTDDTDTIENLLPSVSPFIMPAPGSRPDKAIELAQTLARDSGVGKVQLLLLTDGIQNKDIGRISDVLDTGLASLKVITIGTSAGAPVPMPGSGFLKDGQGNIVMPGLNTGAVEALASALNIPWRNMTLDDSDWQSLISQQAELNPQVDADPHEQQHRFDLWADQGYWLIFLLLPLALLLFRRGVVVSVFLIPFLWPHDSYAFEWLDLWQTKDQQAAEIMKDDPKAAADVFEDPQWKGSAAYKAGDYQSAAEAFSQSADSAVNHYNRGNALAQSGQLQDAVKEYQQALKKDPSLKAAEKNLQTVKKALEQQQKQQQQNQNGQQDDQQQDQQQSQDQQSGQQNQQQNGQQGDQRQNQQQNKQQDQDQKQNNQNGEKPSDNDPQNAEDKQQQASAEQQDDADKDDKTQQQQASAEKNKADKENDGKNPQQAQNDSESTMTREEQAAMQQWLNRVPDKPGNLLQRKFLYQYRQKDNQESGDVLW
ncbi:MAG: hypothetical protein CMI03_05000 [Oceanospirillaceae bacterium]|uniref:vWA domain-containing protein n=1 Tax=unclassified Thalassolituus TaxID=2624967 RepID=UPI000C5A9F7E|nr:MULTISPECIES: VWA domain-containing protein [unclassified Thalassolituus]MBS52091.1 hypothetical protein [Oceanospirillaceae bacterium]|tara:strand:+ start:1878 stop:3773 length:1896 start_codon:yes stop_codon:yes gene_type:complete